MNNKELGDLGEKIAANFIRKKGFEIISSNFRCRRGEIDLIALKGNIIVFFEIKTRKKSSSNFDVKFSITQNKQSHIRDCAKYFLHSHKDYQDFQVRFDVVTVVNGMIEHIENAFW